MLQPHIRLDTLNDVKYALLPGDPARLDKIAKFLENPQELAFNREFRSLRGKYKNINVLALSTGIGGSSAAIAVEEMKNVGVKAVIRIGSCGALQKGIGIGDLIIVSGAVRDDGASRAYADLRYPAVPDTELLFDCIKSAEENAFPHHVGLCHSHESFYIDDNAEQEARWSKLGVLGADMETAAVFTVAAIRGIKAASILNNVVVCGNDTAQSVADYASGEDLCAKGEKNEIITALEAFVRMEN